jgi:hypothetical protein
MTGATVIVLPTGSTHFAVFKHAHAWIKQPIEFALGRVGKQHFTHGSPYDFLRTKYPKLDAHNRLCFG